VRTFVNARGSSALRYRFRLLGDPPSWSANPVVRNNSIKHRSAPECRLSRLVVVSIVMSCACAVQGSEWFASMRQENVKPGEADYPVHNPHPTRLLQIGFLIRYAAVPDANGTARSARYRGYRKNSQAFPQFYVIEPLGI
jgi:hypothetical protein